MRNYEDLLNLKTKLESLTHYSIEYDRALDLEEQRKYKELYNDSYHSVIDFIKEIDKPMNIDYVNVLEEIPNNPDILRGALILKHAVNQYIVDHLPDDITYERK